MAFLKSKVGGVPVGPVFAVLAVLVVVGVYFFTRRSTVPATDSPEPEFTVTEEPRAVSLVSSATPTYVEPSNDEWITRVTSSLSGQNYRGDFVFNALTKWINGDELSSAEQDIVTKAVSVYGLPPNGPSAGTYGVSGPEYPKDVDGFYSSNHGEIWRISGNTRQYVSSPDDVTGPVVVVSSDNPIWRIPISGVDPSGRSVQTVPDGLYNDAINGAVWEVRGGRRKWLSPSEFAAVQKRYAGEGGNIYQYIEQVDRGNHPLWTLPVDGVTPTGGLG